MCMSVYLNNFKYSSASSGNTQIDQHSTWISIYNTEVSRKYLYSDDTDL